MRSRKPSFVVSTFVITALSLFGLALRDFRGRIPVNAENELLKEDSDYLQQGGRQNIHWYTLSSQALAEARRTERPIMLLIGSVWSYEGRLLDRRILTDADVQTILRRNFVCIRIDIDKDPLWTSALLPISSPKLSSGPALQIGFLTPRGELFDHLGRYGIPLADPNVFQRQLLDIRRRYDEEIANQVNYQSMQADDQTVILDTDTAFTADLNSFTSLMVSSVIPKAGGFSKPLGLRPRPVAWSYLLDSDNFKAYQESIDPVLRSCVVDWLDGGFFRGVRSPDWNLPEFDKSAILNAEMAWLLCRDYLIRQDPFVKRILEDTLHSLGSEFIRDGLVATARIGDEDGRGRSERSSFRVPEIQPLWGSDFIPRSEAIWAASNLSLSPTKNRSMVIKVGNIETINDVHFEPLLTKLRELRKDVPSLWTSRPIASVNARVAALYLRCGRVLARKDFIKKGTQMFSAAQVFRIGDDIRHELTGIATSRPYLGDYLGFVEACWEMFLTTGNDEYFRLGRDILLRARTLFKQSDSGVWLAAIPSERDKLIEDIGSPEIIDRIGESLTARMMRMCFRYGLASGETFAKRSLPNENLLDEAFSAQTHYAGLAEAIGTPMAGFMAACMELINGRAVMVIGPGSLNKVPLLEQSGSSVPVIPVSSLGLELPGNGIFALTHGRAVGPLTLEQAKVFMRNGALPASE